MRITFSLLLVLSASIPRIAAQDTLRMEVAVLNALESNYGVRLSQMAYQRNAMLNTPGMAGQLPTVGAGITDQFSASNIFQRFANGQEISSANASGNNVSAFVAVDWTIFNGFRISVERDRLAQMEQEGLILWKQQIAATTAEVMLTYFELVFLHQQMVNTDKIIAYNVERENIARQRFEAGIGARTDWIQSTVDLNNQHQFKESLIMQEQNARIRMNLLLAKEVNTEFEPDPATTISDPNPEELRTALVQDNENILIAKNYELLAEMELKRAKGVGYPVVTASGVYNFSRTDNSAGFSLLNRTYGPGVGISAAIPLYAGGTIKLQKKLAQLDLLGAQLEIENARSRALAEFESACAEFVNVKAMMEIQQSNVSLAQQNLDIYTARYKEGQSSALEVQLAQVTYDTALRNFNELKFRSHTSAITMMWIAGRF
ncbi:MAG: TolC family protein [Flavobacteriales bacterium]|nr:TolC family protein [Flavobacteriales bacterium]